MSFFSEVWVRRDVIEESSATNIVPFHRGEVYNSSQASHVMVLPAVDTSNIEVKVKS